MKENLYKKSPIFLPPISSSEPKTINSPKLQKLTAPIFQRAEDISCIPRSSLGHDESTESYNPPSNLSGYLAIEEALDEIISKLQDTLKKCEIMGIGKIASDYIIPSLENPGYVQEKVSVISSMVDSISSQLTRLIKYTQYSSKFRETRTSTPIKTPSSYSQLKTPLTVNTPFNLDEFLETDVTVAAKQIKQASKDSDLLSKIFDTRSESILLSLEEKKSLGALIIGCVRDSSSQEYQRLYQEAMNKYVISENMLIRYKKLLLEKEQEVEILTEELRK